MCYVLIAAFHTQASRELVDLVRSLPTPSDCVSLPVLQAYGDVVIGSVLGPSSQRANECRIAMFLAGYPETVPVRTVNRCAPTAAPCTNFKRSCCAHRVVWCDRCPCRSSRCIGTCSGHHLCGTASFCLGTPDHQGWGLPLLMIQLSMAWVCRQCSSGLQAVADVAAAIRAGFYNVGLAGGVEAMSQTPMAWEGGVNPRAAKNKKAMSCLIPMGVPQHPLSAFQTIAAANHSWSYASVCCSHIA